MDAILSPTSTVAPELSETAVKTGESNTALVLQLTKHIFLANLLGLPAVSVPAGTDPSSGLPIGAQLMGQWWSEARLLELAAVLEHLQRD